MKSLFTKFYLSVLALIVLFAFAAFGAWHWFGQAETRAGGGRWISELAREKLPNTLSPEQLTSRLHDWHKRMRADLIVVDTAGNVLAFGGSGFVLPAEFSQWRVGKEDGWLKLEFDRHDEKFKRRLRDRGWAYGLALDNGERWMFMRRISGPPHRGMLGSMGPNPFWGFAVSLGVIVLILALASYPLLRHLTRRLEQVEQGVAKFGAGDLSARVPVSGRDELGRVASAFNDAADQVQGLVQAQKNLLANASHELRSPLARLKMAVALSGEKMDPPMRDEIDRNVVELDVLIDEILLSSRLDAHQSGAQTWQASLTAVDIDELVREECLRLSIALPESALNQHNSMANALSNLVSPPKKNYVHGDARLLRRLLRNLLENAQRYAPVDTVRVTLGSTTSTLNSAGDRENAQWILQVIDGGPGIKAADRERIFEPFYRAAGASESAGGVGLGLALVRQIARFHHGTVRCLDRELGSCFEVRLPLQSV